MIRTVTVCSLFFVFLLLLSACAPGRDVFDTARQLEAQSRYDDALSMYEEAIAKEPSNSEYVAARNSVRERLSRQQLEKVRAQIEIVPTRYENLRSAQNYLDKVLKSDPGNVEARTLATSLKSRMDGMLKKAETSYAAGVKALEAGDWVGSLGIFRDIRSYYPGYLDVQAKIAAAENNALAFYLKEADRNRGLDNVEALISNLESALAIQPSNQQILSALNEARGKNTASVAIEKAEKYASENNWQKVAFYVKRARGLRPSQPELERINRLYADAGEKLVAKVRDDLDRKALYSAYIDMMTAFELNPAVLKTAGVDELRSRLITDLTARADEAEAAGFIGLALYWNESAYKVSGTNREIYQKIQGLKDKLKQRVVKKIAVMDFNAPTNNQDAGRLVTDSLLSYMTRNASGEVKILARDILGALIKEIEFGQAGLYDIESAKKSGKLKGTDIFIFGSLLQYNVELNKEEGQKTVIAKIGVDREPNPQYSAWLANNPRATDEERRNAPPPFIEKDKTETIRYKVGSHKKTANVTISFRVVDVESGEVVITKTLKSKKEAVGNYSEGVDIAGIPYQKLELASDTDLLEKAVDEAVSELGHQVLSRFQNLQEKYLNDAEILKKRGETEPVIEKYMDAIITEEVKNIRSPVTETSRREIDRLLKQGENYPI